MSGEAPAPDPAPAPGRFTWLYLVAWLPDLVAYGLVLEALHLAEGTVKNHVSSILSKLGVRDHTRVVLKAVELGYLA